MDLLLQEIGNNKETATHHRFCCPFCNEDDHKFYVAKDSGLYICFKCDERGNPPRFVMNYYSVNFAEAVDILATYDYDVERERQNSNFSFSAADSQLSKEELLMLFIAQGGKPVEVEQTIHYTCPPPPTNCKPLLANFDNPEAIPFFTYLHGRGTTLEHIKRHNISYVIQGEVTKVDGEKMTLINHLVFFTHDDKGYPLYWNTRSIDKGAYIKSFNAPSRPTEYGKNNTIFNLNWAKYSDKIVITEGVFDGLTVPGDSGVATFGKQITIEQVDLLIRETEERQLPIYLYLDRDAGDQMIKSAHRIKAKAPNRPLYFVLGDKARDANDLGPEKVQELIDQAFPADSEGELKLKFANV